MPSETFYRKANVSRQEAIAALSRRFPTADLESFKTVTVNGQKLYAATITSEFPPKKDEGAAPEEPKDEGAPPEDAGEDAPPAPADEDDGGEDKGDEGGDDVPSLGDQGGDDGEDQHGEHKPKASLDEVVNLLHQVLHAIAPGPDVAPGGPGADPGAAGADPAMLDVGAPVPGEELPPPPMGGGQTPLPPPVKHPKDQLGAPAFAHQRVFEAHRDDQHEISNHDLIIEAQQIFPGFRVAKIDRTTLANENKVVSLMVRATA